MARDDGTTGEVHQRLFQTRERLDVEVVGGLVEQQEVAALRERDGQVQAVALAARQHAGGLLLIGSLEAEARHVGAAGHLGLTDHHVVQTSRDDLPHALVVVDALAALVDVGHLHGLAERERAGGGLLLADDHLEQGRLTHAVGADHAHDAVARQLEGQIFDEHALAERLVQMLHAQHLGAQARTGGDADGREIEALALGRLGDHLVVALQTRAAFGLACLGARAHPLQLVGQAFRELLVALLLGGQTRSLRLEVGGVVALVGVEVAAVDLADPLGDVVEEVAVVRDGEHGALVVVQELLKPQHAFGIEMVCRLVKQQQVGRFEQKAAQRHAAALAAREHVDRHVGVGALQRVHRLGQLAVQIPAVFGVDLVLQLAHLVHERVKVRVRIGHLGADLVESLDLGQDVGESHLDVLENGLFLVQRRLLLQDAHGVAGRQTRLAVGNLLEARHQFEQRGLAHAVGAHHADFCAGVERQRHVVEDHLVAVGLACLIHLVDEFRHVASCLSIRGNRFGCRCGAAQGAACLLDRL